jgi:lysophospholipase L1-like esterase
MFLSAALAALAVAAPPDPPKPFEFKDGDRVVWIGNTLVEREQRYGYWETAHLAANADKKITVRTLGWSGDTVFGEARGRFDFDKPDVCFKQLVSLTLELKPTVIFVSYGTNESFGGEAGLPKFEKGLEKLLDSLKPAEARIVLFTPIPFEAGPRFPDPKARNAALQTYADVVRKVAADRKLYLADLSAAVLRRYEEFARLRLARVVREDETLTDNGMHLSEGGYRVTTLSLLQSLGLSGEIPACLTGFELPHALKQLQEDIEPLRQAVVAKNELFFHRWRPENETYLFGFRKHEQGKNAKEVAEFDPLVAEAEKKIADLKAKLVK